MRGVKEKFRGEERFWMQGKLGRRDVERQRVRQIGRKGKMEKVDRGKMEKVDRGSEMGRGKLTGTEGQQGDRKRVEKDR